MKTFRYRITKEDYINAQRVFIKKGIIRAFILMFLTASFVFTLASDASLDLWYMYLVLLAITGFITLIGLPVYQKYSLSKSYDKYTQLKKEHSVQIGEEKVFLENENGASWYQYREFLKIEFTKESILLFIGPKICLIIPKRFLDESSISILEEKSFEIKSLTKSRKNSF